jgi:hypothetical protein
VSGFEPTISSRRYEPCLSVAGRKARNTWLSALFKVNHELDETYQNELGMTGMISAFFEQGECKVQIAQCTRRHGGRPTHYGARNDLTVIKHQCKATVRTARALTAALNKYIQVFQNLVYVIGSFSSCRAVLRIIIEAELCAARTDWAYGLPRGLSACCDNASAK